MSYHCETHIQLRIKKAVFLVVRLGRDDGWLRHEVKTLPCSGVWEEEGISGRQKKSGEVRENPLYLCKMGFVLCFC